MELYMCGRYSCGQPATKFCFNCEILLCPSHRIIDVKDQRERHMPEHWHIDAMEHNKRSSYYQSFYCKSHLQELLVGKCIVCGVSACYKCPPEMCPKAAGCAHDYDSISDFAKQYKEELLELDQLLQKKNETLRVKLKETCRILDETELSLQHLMDKVDEAVESQITALRDDGKKLKEEIAVKKKTLNAQLALQVKALEKMEMECNKLLKRMHKCIIEASGHMLVQNYSALKEDTETLLKEQIHYFHPPSFDLFSAGTELRRPLLLEVRESAPGSEEVYEEVFGLKEKKTEIRKLNINQADKQRYQAVSYRPTCVKRMASEHTVVAGGQGFTETIQGRKMKDRERHKYHVLQMLAYRTEVLMLTWDWSTAMYTIRGLDSGRAVCSFSDSDPHYLYYKPIAATHNRQLLILHVKTQILHTMSLEAGGSREQKLSDGGIKGAYGILVASDGTFIFSCQEQAGHRLTKYNPETRALFQSKLLSDSWLRVMEYKDSLFVIQHNRPTYVWKLRLSDIHVLEKIPCFGLPEEVWDISWRGDTFVIAGDAARISYFKIKEVSKQ